MAATTLTEMPAEFYAGDTLLLLLGSADYPADQGWTLKFDFNKEWTEPPGFAFSFSSTASGANHSFTVSAADTSQWLAGRYHGVGSVTNGTQKFTTWVGEMTVRPQADQLGGNVDVRSHAQKCLDAINAVLEGKATRDVLSSTIAGQTIQRMSFSELISAKSYYELAVQAERVNAGAASNQVLIRFTSP